MAMNFDHIPDEVQKALFDAERDFVEDQMKAAMNTLAVCQQRLKLKGVISTLGENGDVSISVIADASKGKVSYARVHRTTHKLEITGALPEAKENDDTSIDKMIEPNK